MHNAPPPRSTPPTRPPPEPRSQSPSSSQSSCPIQPQDRTSPATTPSTTQRPSPDSTIAALNPLNYMPSDLSQTRESTSQTTALPIARETSSIPRGDPQPSATTSDSNWQYPSPQQMYNAMLRKGYTDTPQDAVEAMVAVHNFLNEGAWAEILEWERRFSSGLRRGWQLSRFGEAGSVTGAMIDPGLASDVDTDAGPRLLRFMGRKDAMTPKAAIMQAAGWVAPGTYGGPPPFDRHDWFVERRTGKGSGDGGDGKGKEVRYVIDYYSAGTQETGEPVFYLDIRPAVDGPSAAAERLIRWTRDVWWRASGGQARLEEGNQ